MRILFWFFIVVMFFCCTPKKESRKFIPPEYEFPTMKAGENKTFAFVESGARDTSFCDYHVYSEEGHELLIANLYTRAEAEDSLIYLDGKLVEHFAHFFQKRFRTKAFIVKDTVVDNGRRYGKRILEEDYYSDSLIDRITAENEFMKDTVFTWKGVRLPTLMIKTSLQLTIMRRFFHNNHQDISASVVSYLARGLGAVRITTYKAYDNKPVTIDLVQIRNLHLQFGR